MSAEQAISRREFLRGDLKGGVSPLRPPWALPESEFTERCNRCGDCVPACPVNLIRLSADGFPRVDFSHAGCDFCRACLEACTPAALVDPKDGSPPWPYRATIDERCLSVMGVVCRACGDACDEQAILFRLQPGGVARPEITVSQCTGCGDCIRPCPVQAVTISTISSDELGDRLE